MYIILPNGGAPYR